jgi:signal transduction histidine kinase
VFAHELRNRLSAVHVGFELIRKGTVASGGSVSSLVGRNLARLAALIDRSLVDVRLYSGIDHRESVVVADLIEDAEVEGALEAAARNVALSVTTIDREVEVHVDRQIVAGAVANLMQNAFKFTPAHGHIQLRALLHGARVRIQVQDECGGLPPGKRDELFDAFTQRGVDRSGLGLGLFISRRGVQANDGSLAVEDLPGKGCVFTIDLPRAGTPAQPRGPSPAILSIT